MTKIMGYYLAGVEKLLQENFLTCLFFVKSESIPCVVGTLSNILVNKSGLGIQKTVFSADEKILS